ncbi:uncharacterized protein LOC108192780 [Daucus carota subsp. sativus]|uniref:uncharacterized protein LOC108192780 n=1 Tax=Daucus carota subsp. sativus TaxID=79200 RepID=UPI003083A36D
MVQDIPPPPTIYSSDLHKMTLKGKTDIDWRDKHKDHILSWNNRLQFVNIIGNEGVGISDHYADWYGNITRPYHTLFAAAQSHVFHILDRISSIAGGVVNGDYNTINVLAKHARRVLESQYSRGLRQDIPADDSFIDKGPEEVKMKRVGHKGGRGGVNAPKKRRMQNDDKRYDNPNDDITVPLNETTISISHEVEDHGLDHRGFDPTPTSWFPNFDLVPDWSQLREQTTEVYPAPLVQDQQATGQLTHVPQHQLVEQQQQPIEEQQPLHVPQENLPMEEQNLAEQELQQPQEEEEEVWPPIPEEPQQHLQHAHGHAMQLRPRKKKGGNTSSMFLVLT